MERYQIILAYDGTHFQGFQRQGSTRTVQLEVETALKRLGWQDRIILFAGRTDTGVHASGQVLAVDLDWPHEPDALKRALNANLPEDVAVQAVSRADAEFHPRYHALARTYHYHIYCQPERHPLRERYAWRVWPGLDGQKLESAAAILPGNHDFSAFGTPPRQGGSTFRTVKAARWMEESGGWRFEVTANAFLYHMVRRLVFGQVLTASGRITGKQWQAAVEQAVPFSPGLAAPAGLVLVEVRYTQQEDESEGLINL